MKNEINISIIQNYMLKNKLTKTKFCKLCGISVAIFNKIIRNDLNFGIKSLFKIAKVLNIEIYELFDCWNVSS